LWFLISSLAVSMHVSLLIWLFLIYQSAFIMSLSFLFCHLSNILILFLEAVPRNWQTYVQIGFIIFGSTALHGPWSSSEASVSWSIRLFLLQISWQQSFPGWGCQLQASK
jgi:hypothetical protein